MTYPRNRIKDAPPNQNFGHTRIEKTKRETQDQDVVKRVVDDVGDERSDGLGSGSESEVGDGFSEPLGEGPNVGTEEGVNGVD